MGGEPIVVLGCTNQASMNALFTEATARGLLASPIRDAGRTEVDPGTMTVMAIGPAPASKVDAVTGKLRLL
jgi:PTH2 family peptidyl-tRNA hydrolase